MDRSLVLARFEAEYLDPQSITPMRRVEQLRLLERFAETLDGRSLIDLTQQDVVTFIGAEIKRGLHPNTGRKHLGMLRSFITWADSAGLIEAERTRQLRSVSNPRGSAPTSRPRPYRPAEIARFKAELAEKYPALPMRGRGSRFMHVFMKGHKPRLESHLWRHARRLQLEAQVALALEQGLRRGEIRSLTIPALHYDNDQVVVLTSKQGPGVVVTRSIPYNPHARLCMQEWLDFRRLLRVDHDEPWLMISRKGNLAEQTAPQTMRAMRDALAWLDPSRQWSWHRFRHTCATEWLRSGVPLEKVRRYMGHSSLEQTLAYAEILNSDMDSAFEAAQEKFAERLGLAS